MSEAVKCVGQALAKAADDSYAKHAEFWDGFARVAVEAMPAVQTLVQAELDDAYHRAIFDCDEALALVIRRMFHHYQERMEIKGVSQSVWNSIRDDMHNVLSETFNDCEIKHLGAKRYAQLLDRIMQRDPDKVNRPT